VKLCGRVVEVKRTVKRKNALLEGYAKEKQGSQFGWSRAIMEMQTFKAVTRARLCRHWKKFGFSSKWNWELLEGFEKRIDVI